MKQIKFYLAITLVLLVLFSGCAALNAPKMENSSMTDRDNCDFMFENPSNESYLAIKENRFTPTNDKAAVSFSLKVDTASYSNIERYIRNGQLPPADAIRTEELLNYFSYEKSLAFSDDTFASYIEIGPSPFDPNKSLAFIRVKTRELDKDNLPPCNFTFLIDTSGSMSSYDKLPLLKESLNLFVETLREQDRISIVTYAGSSEVLLESVFGSEKSIIKEAINSLNASGSTNGEGGIHTAYRLAEQNYVKDGNNRIILATDGDFNVGVSSNEALAELISEKRYSGIYLSILGFGTGNIRDDLMETLSQNGNGNYSYINSLSTAKKVLISEMSSNLYTVAKDVKAQVAFNPITVESYRLIGYENRIMTNEEFKDTEKDAGEIGAGADIVLLFELDMKKSIDKDNELFELRLHYKDPANDKNKEFNAKAKGTDITKNPGSDFQFASSVAIFSHLLRDSEYTGQATLYTAQNLAGENLGKDADGWRAQYMDLLREYKQLENK